MVHKRMVTRWMREMVRVKGDGINGSVVLSPLLGHAFVLQSIQMSDVVDSLARDKSDGRRVSAQIDTIDIEGPDITIGRVEMGMEMSMSGFHSVVEGNSIALTNPFDVLILVGEFHTVNGITQLVTISVLIDPSRVIVHLAMIMMRHAGQSSFSSLLTSRRTGSITMLRPRHKSFPRSVVSFGRVNGGRPPRGLKRMGKTDGMTSGINMTGIVVIFFVVVVVAMSDVIIVQTRDE